MSFKNRWQREKLKKRLNKGFRGYPAATIACYGPTDERASKLVVAIIQHEGGEPELMKKWNSDDLDVRNDPRSQLMCFSFSLHIARRALL